MIEEAYGTEPEYFESQTVILYLEPQGRGKSLIPPRIAYVDRTITDVRVVDGDTIGLWAEHNKVMLNPGDGKWYEYTAEHLYYLAERVVELLDFLKDDEGDRVFVAKMSDAKMLSIPIQDLTPGERAEWMAQYKLDTGKAHVAAHKPDYMCWKCHVAPPATDCNGLCVDCADTSWDINI